ncbi:MAG: hypothetical protein Tsb0018_01460 [Opitutales bacterium]
MLLGASSLSWADESGERKKQREASRLKFSAASSVYHSVKSLLPYYSDDDLNEVFCLFEEHYQRALTAHTVLRLMHWWLSIFKDMPSSGNPGILTSRFNALLTYLNEEEVGLAVDYLTLLGLLARGEQIQTLSDQNVLGYIWVRIYCALGLGTASRVDAFRKSLEAFLNSNHAREVRRALVLIARAGINELEEGDERDDLQRIHDAMVGVENAWIRLINPFFEAAPMMTQRLMERHLPEEFRNNREARRAREGFYDESVRYQEVMQNIGLLYPQYAGVGDNLVNNEEGGTSNRDNNVLGMNPVAGYEMVPVIGPHAGVGIIEFMVNGQPPIPPLIPSTLRASITQGGSFIRSSL